MLFIMGNKCDLESMRIVTPESILEFKEQNQIMYSAETSAKTGQNVERMFIDCARFLYIKYNDIQ